MLIACKELHWDQPQFKIHNLTQQGQKECKTFVGQLQLEVRYKMWGPCYCKVPDVSDYAISGEDMTSHIAFKGDAIYYAQSGHDPARSLVNPSPLFCGGGQRQ